ncbi:retrovirus-related pol polyprotein from transposon TNT 1-94, partial [Tanacetum coccineum]
IHKDGDGDASFQLKSDSLPHAHAQSTKTFYKHQDSRIMKAQELKTKTSANSDIKDNSSEIKLRGRLLASFQDDAKYEHVGQDTRSQGGKDDQDKQGKDLKISDIKTKSKDNDKGSRSKITKHEGTSLQRIQRPRPQDLNDKSNLIDLMKECHNELTSGEIVSLKILSRTRNESDFGFRQKLIDEFTLSEVSSSTLWIKAVPIKVNILAWKIKLDNLPTRLNISCRGMDIDSILCPTCGKAVESTRHIFFTCQIARDILHLITSW